MSLGFSRLLFALADSKTSFDRHVIDLPLVFNLDTLWEKGAHEESASKTFGTLWYNFAKTGVPGSFSFLLVVARCMLNPACMWLDPDWKPFTIEEPSWFAIDNVGNGANEDLKGWEVGRVDFTGRGFCLPKVRPGHLAAAVCGDS